METAVDGDGDSLMDLSQATTSGAGSGADKVAARQHVRTLAEVRARIASGDYEVDLMAFQVGAS